MVTYALILTIMALVGVFIWWESRRATEGWLCSYCHELNQSGNFCQWCGSNKEIVDEDECKYR